MISIAKENLDAEVFQYVLRDAFYSCVRPYRHEDGRLNRAMRGNQPPTAGRASCCSNFETDGHLPNSTEVTFIACRFWIETSEREG
jgi:hypothetical protein